MENRSRKYINLPKSNSSRNFWPYIPYNWAATSKVTLAYTGEYQHAYGMELLGKTTVSVDATGTLIIAGDTIPDVLRIHTERRFVQDLNLSNESVMAEDSTLWLRRFTRTVSHIALTQTHLLHRPILTVGMASSYRYPVIRDSGKHPNPPRCSHSSFSDCFLLSSG